MIRVKRLITSENDIYIPPFVAEQEGKKILRPPFGMGKEANCRLYTVRQSALEGRRSSEKSIAYLSCDNKTKFYKSG
jgi:hypothetical protein